MLPPLPLAVAPAPPLPDCNEIPAPLPAVVVAAPLPPVTLSTVAALPEAGVASVILVPP